MEEENCADLLMNTVVYPKGEKADPGSIRIHWDPLGSKTKIGQK